MQPPEKYSAALIGGHAEGGAGKPDSFFKSGRPHGTSFLILFPTSPFPDFWPVGIVYPPGISIVLLQSQTCLSQYDMFSVSIDPWLFGPSVLIHPLLGAVGSRGSGDSSLQCFRLGFFWGGADPPPLNPQLPHPGGSRCHLSATHPEPLLTFPSALFTVCGHR